jgi:hypothetical protein
MLSAWVSSGADMHCGGCKHWLRARIDTYALDFTDGVGKPHPWAGTTRSSRPNWECLSAEQDVGTCRLISYDNAEGIDSGPLAVATCENEQIYGELVTDAKFGCILFEHAPEGWDHFERRTWHR